MTRVPTDRLGLSKIDSADEPYDYSIEFGTNLDAIDGAVGAHECTSSTRPTGAGAWTGRIIRQTDDGKMYVLDEDGVNWRQIIANVSSSVPIDANTTITGTLTVTGTLTTGLPIVDQQEFTADGTWTKPSGAKTVVVECVGGGGAGGGAPSTAGGQASAGGGGQAGAYCRSVFAASDLSATEAVDIGAGGTGASGTTGGNGAATTFAAGTAEEVSAAGGNGGTFLAAGNTFGVTGAGTMTQTNVGQFAVQGNAGMWGLRNGPDAAGAGGNGGPGYFGGGAPGTGNVTGASGVAGGGGAGSSNNASGAAKAGGAGGAGRCIVTTYFA